MNHLEKKGLIMFFSEEINDETADQLLVEAASISMEEKLAKKRDNGRGGWYTCNVTNKTLLNMLSEHVTKGDMVDVMNIAAMIYVREILYGNTA